MSILRDGAGLLASLMALVSVVYFSINDLNKSLMVSDPAGSVSYVEPVPQVDFSVIEQSMMELSSLKTTDLAISSDLVAVLNRATNPYKDAYLTSSELKRIQFLIKKALPGDKGVLLAKIFPRFLVYRQREYKLISGLYKKGGTLNSKSELDRFDELILLRQSILGKELADKLYREQNDLVRSVLHQRFLLDNNRGSGWGA